MEIIDWKVAITSFAVYVLMGLLYIQIYKECFDEITDEVARKYIWNNGDFTDKDKEDLRAILKKHNYTGNWHNFLLRKLFMPFSLLYLIVCSIMKVFGSSEEE